MSDDKHSMAPGLLLTTFIAISAYWIHALPIWPFTINASRPHRISAILIAIILGTLTRNFLPSVRPIEAGVKYSVHSLLPFAIVILGASIDFRLILKMGARVLAVNVFCATLAIVLTYYLSGKVKLPEKLGTLIGILNTHYLRKLTGNMYACDLKIKSESSTVLLT